MSGLFDALTEITNSLRAYNKTYPRPVRILKSGNRTIVFWDDGDKTVVKRALDEQESDYAAFTAALGIKCYGSNSALKRIVDRTEIQKKGEKKERKELLSIMFECEKCGYRFIENEKDIHTDSNGVAFLRCPLCRTLNNFRITDRLREKSSCCDGEIGCCQIDFDLIDKKLSEQKTSDQIFEELNGVVNNPDGLFGQMGLV